jgi:hypothetical protein
MNWSTYILLAVFWLWVIAVGIACLAVLGALAVAAAAAMCVGLVTIRVVDLVRQRRAR